MLVTILFFDYYNKMKRILIFSLAYFPKHVGGAEIAIKEISDRILVEDIQFHMVTLRFDSTLPAVEQVGNVACHTGRRRCFFNLLHDGRWIVSDVSADGVTDIAHVLASSGKSHA